MRVLKFLAMTSEGVGSVITVRYTQKMGEESLRLPNPPVQELAYQAVESSKS